MLVGLLFATRETDDRPGRLTATLPFGGVTLIEYQARLLVAAGCAQIVILVAWPTPELLGAIARIGRRGVAVDAVRHASEAAAKLHPHARLLVLADGLVTTRRVAAMLAGDGAETLLVVPQDEGARSFERVGGAMAWAGLARLAPQRMAEVARLPSDYDPQSSLLRVAEQAGAAHVLLPPDAARHGHGIEHDGKALATRRRAALAAMVADRRGWFDRLIVAPLARTALPPLVERRWPGGAVSGAGLVLGLAGTVAIARAWDRTGLVLAVLACLVLALGATLSGMRDEPLAERLGLGAGLAVPALAVLVLGAVASEQTGDLTALVLAVALVGLAALAERAGPERVRRRWWGSAPAYLLVVTLAAVAGWPRAGMAVAAGYAALTLAAAIERLRQQG